MYRTHVISLGLILSTTLGASVMAQTSPASARAAGNATVAGASNSPLPAQTLIDQAVKVAKTENKTVLVHVGASWCGWCDKFEQALHSPEIGPIISAHYVLVPLTAMETDAAKKKLENPGVDSVMKALDTPINANTSLPIYVFVDAAGKKIASSLFIPPNNDNIGYPAEPNEIKAFGDLLQKTAPRMTAADRAKVTDYLKSKAK